MLDWHLAPAGRAGNPVSSGVYRLAGRARDRRDVMPWSLVLKIVRAPGGEPLPGMAASAEPRHWSYWRRELEVYRSGLLRDLPKGFAAPECYALEERSGAAWLWLEDVGDARQAPWRDEQCRIAARHLGRFNGHHLRDDGRPAFPWLGVGLLKQWCLALAAARQGAELPRLGPAFRALLSARARLFHTLDSLPHSLCHRDASPDNLRARRGDDGCVETVALDWALTGVAPLGEELAALAVWATAHVRAEELVAWEQTVFESYLDGLRDSAWRGDAEAVRFAYVATAALRAGLWLIRGAWTGEQAGRRASSGDAGFVEALATEALELLDVTKVNVEQTATKGTRRCPCLSN